MTNLMWQDHPSSLAQLPTWSMPAQKSAKIVFFEENDKSSSPKWSDQDDKEVPIAPLWNYGAPNEENASSSAATSAEKSKDVPLSEKEEKAPSAEESQPLSDTTPPEGGWAPW
jgi:predicted FMN-binding regulatory protein PaiB